jgi:hypothetical protein
MRTNKIRVLSTAGIALMLTLSGCSVGLELTRPDPVNVNQYVVGTSRDQVRTNLGAPASTTTQGEYSCDNYQLVTRGPDGAQKAAIVFGEVAIDALTLGIAELATTPAELATRNGERFVSFCYDAKNVLAMRSSN